MPNADHEPPTCILTGAEGENPDDCTTHDHEGQNAEYASLDFDGEPRHTDLPEGSLATCRYCHEDILLDQREGGGPGKDWGSSPADWVGNGGIGMDYGCGGHPANSDDGTWGHVPAYETIRGQIDSSEGE